jgi:hypothetical protein
MPPRAAIRHRWLSDEKIFLERSDGICLRLPTFWGTGVGDTPANSSCLRIDKNDVLFDHFHDGFLSGSGLLPVPTACTTRAAE